MPKPTAAQRREEAIAEALRKRQEQEKAANRQRVLAISLLGVGLVVLVGLVVWILSNQAEPAPDFSEAENPLSEVTAPTPANEQGGIEVGPEGLAGTTEGAEADAVVVTVYSDYLCPVCQTFEQMNGPVLDELRESREVIVEYRPVSILDRNSAGSQYPTRAATAAALVADQAPDAFIALNDLLMVNQPEQGTRGLSDEQIADLAREAGAPEEVAAQIADGSYMEGPDSFSHWVAAATEQATRDFPAGFGTPTILVDGQNLADLGVDWRIPGALELTVDEARG